MRTVLDERVCTYLCVEPADSLSVSLQRCTVTFPCCNKTQQWRQLAEEEFGLMVTEGESVVCVAMMGALQQTGS